MPEPLRPLSFVHRYTPAKNGAAGTLLLLHGTGGTEDDLLPLGAVLAPGAGMLSPRGKVLEDGMPRFFRRIAPGVFDLEDLARRTSELAQFVEEAALTYGFAPERLTAVGYSNGANIATSLLLTRPALTRAAILFRPMVPFVPDPPAALSGTQVFLAAGKGDPMVAPGETERLQRLLASAGADVTLHWSAAGHQLDRSEIEEARRWKAALPTRRDAAAR